MTSAELRGRLKTIINLWLDDIPLTSAALPDEEEVCELAETLAKFIIAHESLPD